MNFREKRLFQCTEEDIAEFDASTIAANADLTVEDPVGHAIDDFAVPFSGVLCMKHRLDTVENDVRF